MFFTQVNTCFETNNLFSPNQFGFRKNCSTTHALMSLTDYIYESIDKDKVCPIIMLDLQKAFDSVDRDILFKKLS